MHLIALLSLLTAGSQDFDAGSHPLLMQHPTMNATDIVFQYADDLWSVPRSGGAAHRITSSPGVERAPYFSPDGKWIAFTGEYDGNADVFVMPAEGGVPKRLTAHPGADICVGWAPDGKSVIFASRMLSNTDAIRLFSAPVIGGFPTPLPFPSVGLTASMSPNAKQIAYVPNIKWENAWKRYRGGQAFRIWIGDMSDSHVKQIPKGNGNDEYPMWVGDKIYFLSDRGGPVGLYSYDNNSGKVNVEVPGKGFDLKSASAGPGGIVYEKLGGIYIYNPESHESHQVNITIDGDFSESRPQFKNILENLGTVGISPSGNRVVVEGRGWIATVPAKKGDARLLDSTQGAHRRNPAWSPDGKTIAYITDVNGGRQELALWDIAASKEKRVRLGESPAFYNQLIWSPDGSKISYTDYRHYVWIHDLKSGENTKVDKPTYGDPTHQPNPLWSPDSKWITFSRDLSNHYNAIFLYELATKKLTQITDGFADADNPVFDHSGKYLYFTASTNRGAASSWLDLSNHTVPNVVSSVYAVVLKKDTPNPLKPESDEEPIKADAPPTPPIPGPPGKETPKQPAKPDAPKADAPMPDMSKPDTKKAEAPAAEAPKPNLIDLDQIESRIIALPMPTLNYVASAQGADGSVYFLSLPPKALATSPQMPGTMWKFSFASRSATPFSQGVTGFDVTPDGQKVLIMHGPSAQIVNGMAPVTSPEEGVVNVSDIEVKVDPRAEWKHMNAEIWENERNCFYAANLHGIDSYAMEKRYAPFFETVQSRRDLNYLFEDMLGEISIGHMFPGGGDETHTKSVRGGLLGADYAFDHGKYRITRVYTGERWNPRLYAPLAQPGVLAKAGDYVLAVDGVELSSSTDIYERLEGKAGKQVSIKIGPNPDGSGSREVIVVPVGDEFELRRRAWTEDNRKYVEKMTNGRAGYVHVPDTATGGWTEFQRYYFAEVGKDGIVVDERFNHGGLINDYMIDEMKKTLDAAFVPRYMQPWPTPGAAIFGPKVMLANEFAGSGGDMFPWLFKHNKIGKLIGKRTWGGLVAAASFTLVDGGSINAPDYAFFNVDQGTWDVENWGTAPDIEVELDPYQWRKGHDAQLDRAIQEMNKALEGYKPVMLKRPPYPDKTKLDVRY